MSLAVPHYVTDLRARRVVKAPAGSPPSPSCIAAPPPKSSSVRNRRRPSTHAGWRGAKGGVDSSPIQSKPV